MAQGDQDDFGDQYERNSHRAHLSAYVLVAGLVLELITAAIWYKGLETLVDMIAVLLIVGGVWGEVFFGHKARLAGDKQLAQYEARAKEASLMLAKYAAPRSLTIEQTQQAAEELRPFAGQQFRCAVQSSDPEQMNCLSSIITALRAAGWEQVDWVGPGVTYGAPEGRVSVGVGIAVSDVMLAVHPQFWEQMQDLLSALTKALLRAGIAAISSTNPRANMLHIMIGPKRHLFSVDIT